MKTTLFARMADGVDWKKAGMRMLAGLMVFGVCCAAFIIYATWTAIQSST